MEAYGPMGPLTSRRPVLKFMACDVTVPDIYVESSIDKTANKSDAAAHRAVQNMMNKLPRWPSHFTRILHLFAIETADIWPQS